MEEGLAAPIRQGGEVVAELVGHLDAREVGRIRDLKSGTTRRANQAQYGGYAILATLNGIPVGEIVEDYIQRVKVDAPQPPPELHQYTLTTATTAAKTIIKGIIREFQDFSATGEPWAFPANPMSMMCKDKFCPAWGTDFCQEHTL